MHRTAAQFLRSISFSGAGFLGSYHCGVIAALQKAGAIPDYSGTAAPGGGSAHDDLHFLGSSAGALVSAAVVTGQPISTVMDTCHHLSAEARKQVSRQGLAGPLRTLLLLWSMLFFRGLFPRGKAGWGLSLLHSVGSNDGA